MSRNNPKYPKINEIEAIKEANAELRQKNSRLLLLIEEQQRRIKEYHEAMDLIVDKLFPDADAEEREDIFFNAEYIDKIEELISKAL